MQIIIIGAGKVGYTVASQLVNEGHQITVIDKSDAALREALGGMDVAGFVGSGLSREVLEEANANGADLLIALTGGDELNLLICLLAKNLGAKNTIARVRGPEYRSILPLMANDLGLSTAVNPEREAAMEIARILELPLAKKVENFARGRVEMIDYDITAESPMAGKLVKDVFANLRSALVCAVERGGEAFIPLGDFRFEAGDVITVIAPSGRLGEFFKSTGERRHSVKKVIISGGGRVSYYLARQLLSQRIRVAIIERDPQIAYTLSEALPQADICVGDGTSRSVLEENGIIGADAFCCLTGIDEENILTSLYAKHVAPDIKTVTKLNRVELVPIVKPLGIGSVVSPKLIASDQVVSYVRAMQNGVGSGVITLYRIVGDKAEALEFAVSSKSRLLNVPIRELRLKENVIIACINRMGRIISPRGDDVLQNGDSVIVVTTHTGFDLLDDIIKD